MSAHRYRETASAMTQRLGPIVAWWQGLSSRERRGLSIAAMVMALAVLWLFAIAPAWRLVQRAPAERVRLDQQLANMRRMANLAAQLRATPAVTPAESTLALKTATERLGAKARWSAQGDRYVVKLNGLELDELGPWLDELRSVARTKPLEMRLVRAAKGYEGTVVFAVVVKP